MEREGNADTSLRDLGKYEWPDMPKIKAAQSDSVLGASQGVHMAAQFSNICEINFLNKRKLLKLWRSHSWSGATNVSLFCNLKAWKFSDSSKRLQ